MNIEILLIIGIMCNSIAAISGGLLLIFRRNCKDWERRYYNLLPYITIFNVVSAIGMILRYDYLFN